MILKRNYFNETKSTDKTIPWGKSLSFQTSSLPLQLAQFHKCFRNTSPYLPVRAEQSSRAHDTGRWEKASGHHDQYCCVKTFDSLFWDHRRKISEGLCSGRETRQTCTEQDIQLSGSWWSPSCRSNGADACTALCQTAGTQRAAIWFTYTRDTDVKNFTF